MKKLIMVLVLLFSVIFINGAFAAEDITGTWQGKLVPAPGSELEIQFVITKGDDGAYSVVLNSPDQGAIKDIKASSVVYDSGKLTLDVTDLSGAYEGVLKDGKFEGNWKQEGTLIPLNLKPYEKPVLSKEGKEKLKGQWHGDLEIPTGAQTLVFRFEMDDKGELKGFLDLPSSGAKGIPVNDIELSDGDLKLKITAAQLEYKAKLAGDKLTGETVIGGAQKFPLILTKGEFKAPVITLNLPKEVKEGLSGEWHWQLPTPRGLIHMAFRFETTEKGEFVGFYDIPDQNAKGLPITEANFSDGKLTVKVKILNAEFNGKMSGDELKGEWVQAGLSTTSVTMKKGEYAPPVFSLDLPEETKKLLEGEWHGQRKMPQRGFYHVSFRFETNDKGEFLGFYEVPDQNQKDIPVTEASLSDGNLVLKMQKRVNIEFKGKLAGDKLTGQMIQPGVAGTTASLKKGKYVPPVYPLDLPDETKKLLEGEWYGDLKPPTTTVTVVFNFKTNEKGEFVGIEEIPDQNINGLLVSEASFSDGKLAFTVTDAEFKGEISGDEIKGEAMPGGVNSQPIPFTLKKGKYVPPDYSLNLPGDVIKNLEGKWEGKLGNLTIHFRFKKNEKGKLIGHLDSPDQGANDIRFTEGSMSDGKLVLKAKILNADFTGKMSKDSLEGEWHQGGQTIPFTLKKE